MKKLIVGLLFVAGLTSIAKAACMLGTAVCADDRGNVSIAGQLVNGNGDALPSMTKAVMTAATPNSAGQEIYCSDCTRTYICISSGTTQGAYVVAVETGTMANNPTHCQ